MIALWNVDTLELIDCFIAHNGCVTDLCPNVHRGRFLSVSYDGYIKTWSSNGKMISNTLGHEERIWSVSESSCGDFVATASADHTVKLWDRRLGLLKTHRFSDMPVSCKIIKEYRKICVGHRSGALTWLKI